MNNNDSIQSNARGSNFLRDCPSLDLKGIFFNKNKGKYSKSVN